MPRGKRPHFDKPIDWKISIPTSLSLAVEDKLVQVSASWRNPEKASYGARSKLVKQLLEAFVAGEIEISSF